MKFRSLLLLNLTVLSISSVCSAFAETEETFLVTQIEVFTPNPQSEEKGLIDDVDPSALPAIGSAIVNRKTGEKIDAVYLNSDKPDFAGRTFFRYRYSDPNGNLQFIGPTYITTNLSLNEERMKRNLFEMNRIYRDKKMKYFWATQIIYGKWYEAAGEPVTVAFFSGLVAPGAIAMLGFIPGASFFVYLAPLPFLPPVIDLIKAPVVAVQRTINNIDLKISSKRIGKAFDVVFDEDSKNFKISNRKFNLILDTLKIPLTKH